MRAQSMTRLRRAAAADDLARTENTSGHLHREMADATAARDADRVPRENSCLRAFLSRRVWNGIFAAGDRPAKRDPKTMSPRRDRKLETTRSENGQKNGLPACRLEGGGFGSSACKATDWEARRRRVNIERCLESAGSYTARSASPPTADSVSPN